MRSSRVRILAIIGVLLAAGAGVWLLLPSAEGREGPITVGTTDVVSDLDPAGAYDVGSWALYSNVYQTLMSFKPGAESPSPDAARSCAFLGDELDTYQCKLRDDITFSNGNKITAEAVKYSFDRVLKIKSKVGPAPLLSTLKSVEAEGDTITFNLKTRDATFPSKIATGAAAIVDPAKYPADAVRKGNEVDGSGPYILKSRTKDTVLLEPNPSYKGLFSNDGQPIKIRYYEDSELLKAAWDAKEIDVVHRELPSSYLSELAPTNKDRHVNITAGTETRNLVFNVRKGKPGAEVNVRRAVATLIDRTKLASTTFNGTVEPLYSVIPQGVLGHSTAFFDTYPEPSAKAAERLLQEAGVETPVGIKLGYRKTVSAEAEAQALKKELEADDLFKVELVGKEEWTEFQNAYTSGEYDAYTLSWIADFPDPDNFAGPLVGADNSLGNGYSDPEIDKLIQQTQQHSDRGRAVEPFKKIQEIVAKDVPVVPLWQRKDYVLADKDVVGSHILSDSTGMWRLWELGWI
ncbi:ABC transporter substrate-binding protein [Streptomyces sannanensis]|uniref:ABC transporter substrate-binding protein n=1 Tax=Streptomyces sannanensis TaxID=285536 RepID=A0ABP6SE63_9ACTN